MDSNHDRITNLPTFDNLLTRLPPMNANQGQNLLPSISLNSPPSPPYNIHNPKPVLLPPLTSNNLTYNDYQAYKPPATNMLLNKNLAPLSPPLSEPRSRSSSGSGNVTVLPSIAYSYDFGSESQDSDETEKKQKTKPRRKRQCPECKLFFSNLATHKSTHLKPDSRPHICEYCSRGFARPNDLFRHTKRHWKEMGTDQGQFKCPFNKAYLETEPEAATTKKEHCHPTGIFSRCDTFKNHLKALHFEYPLGTKKNQRNHVDGNCKRCGKHFRNVDEWLVNHIDKKQCPGSNETCDQ